MSIESLKLSLPELHHKDQLFFIGSCFSDQMSLRLAKDKVEVKSNPFGIMFHPESILTSLNRVIEQRQFQEVDFFKWDGYWHCFEHHSHLSEKDLARYIDKSNRLLVDTRKHLLQTDTLFLTLGSSWGYEKDGAVVANCHKQSPALFEKKIFDLDRLLELFIKTLTALKTINKKLNIVLTVSPVKHHKDGILENQRSKSLLNILSHSLCEKVDKVFYFPSYEYVTDYLRDYSFYKQDLVHPNERAVAEVYEFFKRQFFDGESQKLIAKWRSLKMSCDHRSIREYSPSNLSFKENLKNKLEKFELQSGVNCGNEIKNLEKEISKIRQEI